MTDDDCYEAVGSCDECGVDIFEDDDGLCSQCSWKAHQAEGEKDVDAHLTRRRFVYCEVCGRGLNSEDLELNNGMCLPCSLE